MNYLKNKKFIILSLIILTIPIIIFSYGKINNEESNSIVIAKVGEAEEIEKLTEKVDSFYVDIKGSIKNPGVYVMSDGDIINDLITKAGGLKKDAYTNNINLSRELSSEMMVYVYSNSEIDNENENIISDSVCICNEVECTPCIEKECSIIVSDNMENINETDEQTDNIVVSDGSTEQNNKISINNATKEELMTLTGIGESKATAIIEYRSINNGFNSIDELLKVSGIGESIFDKIKESITL